MTRREIREATMQILFTYDFNNVTLIEAKKSVLNELDDEYLTKIIESYENNKTRIDELISLSLVNYTLERLNLTDKAIMRSAVSELLLEESDKKIVINEALEITKKFSDTGDHKAVSFNNKVLDRIALKLGK